MLYFSKVWGSCLCLCVCVCVCVCVYCVCVSRPFLDCFQKLLMYRSEIWCKFLSIISRSSEKKIGEFWPIGGSGGGVQSRVGQPIFAIFDPKSIKIHIKSYITHFFVWYLLYWDFFNNFEKKNFSIRTILNFFYSEESRVPFFFKEP